MTVTDDDNVAAARRRGAGAQGTGAQGTRTPGATRQRSAAAEKALDRRRKRLGAQAGSSTSRHWQRREEPTAARAKAAREKPALWTRVSSAPMLAMRRVPFVVVVVGMLLAGLALTLWLSTKSAQDSYQLSVERAYNEQLSDRRDALQKQYESGDAAPELSEKASQLGMIPVNDKARLVVGADGRATVVGEIKAAEGDKAPSMNNAPKATAPAPAATPATPEATTPGVQGIPVQGTPVTADGDTATPVPTTPAAPAATASPEAPSPPAYSNVLPSNGGAPGSNSAEER